jgi:Cof subfamily protein (haloacid dehalogenase superfamily)
VSGRLLPDDFPRSVEVVATDYDRTLVWGDATLHERTIAVLRRASEAGLTVVVVTGRMVQSIRRALEPARLHAPVICYQGAVVADAEGRWLRHDPLPIELARETIAALAEEGYSPNVYVGDELYVAADTQEARAYAELNRIRFHVVGDLLDWLTEPPTKLVCVGEPRALDDVEVRMKQRLGDREYISKSLPHFLEFAQAGVTKGSGLDFLSEHLGFSRESTIAFGDGENDIELVEWPPYGIAVANAHPRVKAVARWVCPPAADEGVAQVLEALLDSRA